MLLGVYRISVIRCDMEGTGIVRGGMWNAEMYVGGGERRI
jgi:hypothetical protein